MGSDTPGRQRISRPVFEVDLSYPTVTPQGYAVDRVEERIQHHRGDLERVHLTSPGSAELYVELVRFRDLAPEDEYAGHKAYLEQRFGAAAVTALTPTTVRERPAWTYAFRWEDGERSVLSFAVGGRDTYRVIYDPRSDLNSEVIATLTIAE